jgi:phage terminase large subunit
MSEERGIFDLDWTKPDYGPIFEFRAEALQRLRENPQALARLKLYYKDHWVDFINDWGMTFDPRKQGQKYAPFILFPRQEAYINWLYESYTQGERGLAEKSREVGFTWLCVAAGVCIWMFYPDAVVGFGSRKKELVDNGDADPDSIFWKARMFIDSLPVDFLPPNHTRGRKGMVIPNPGNRAVIKGEIGDEIGRGGRAGIYFVDEFAHLEHPDMAESALSANTDCRIYVSTVNGPGNLFYRLRHFLSTKQIFIFDWKDDPRKRLNPDLPADQEPWYIKQKKDLLPTTLASQVDRNYHAASASGFLGEDGTEALKAGMARSVTSVLQPDSVPWKMGIDAAGMGNDEIILWARRGRLNLEPKIYQKMDGVQLAGLIEHYADLLVQSGPIDLISIERDGPGGSAADQLSYGRYKSIVRAVHTGAKLKDGKNYNLRAYLHVQARDYIIEQECVLPNDNIFEGQATAIQNLFKGGLLLIESKDEYRARFALGRGKQEKAASKSPDRWDAFMLTFTPSRAKPIQQTGSDDEFFPRRNKSGWKPQDRMMGY